MNWKKWLIPIFVLGLLVVLKVTPLGVILKYKFFPHYPKNKAEKLTMQGLKNPVEVYFDEYGVPHIEAQNIPDLTRAVGFIHARYRFFQLDILRRFASGRIAELVGEQKILGSTTVDFDLAMRGWGIHHKSQVDLNSLNATDRELLTAMTDGINQGANAFRPVEYDILGVEPEPWTVADTLSVSLLQAWSITHNWEQEAVRFNIALSLGLEMAEKIYSNDPLPTRSTIEKANKSKIPLPERVAQEIINLFPVKPKTVDAGNLQNNYSLSALAQLRPSASNAWVVGKSRSNSNMPILSNDMHLTHSLPSMLFLQHIKAPGLDAIGGTMPGLPFLIGGHNGKVAWGATSAVADVVDLIIEKIDPNDKNYVLNESKKCPMSYDLEKVNVRDGAKMITREYTIRRTCNGALVNDIYPKFLPADAPMVAIRWELPNVESSLSHLLKANMANNVDELREHLMHIPSPVQNITASDISGNIAFFSTGSVPIRKNHRGTFPVPGWLKKYEWDGWTKIEDMPYVKNPAADYIVNTNNQVVDPLVHRPLFHIDSAPSYRFERAESLILEKKKHDRDSIQKVQLDHILLRAKRVAPAMLADLQNAKIEMNDQQKQALSYLQAWDYNSHANSQAMTIFMTMYRESILKVFSEKLTVAAQNLFLQQRYSTTTVDTWFDDAEHVIWDDLSTPKKELRSDVVLHAFNAALKILNEKLGPDISKWNWGQLHYYQPKHLFGSKSILNFFNLERIGLNGSLDSVWKAHFNLHHTEDPFKVVAGPVFRLAIDMADIQSAQYSIDTGVSGWPLDPHYGDIYQKWQQGELIPMHYDWNKIKKKFTLLQLQN
jgi:penicillin G amidase